MKKRRELKKSVKKELKSKKGSKGINISSDDKLGGEAKIVLAKEDLKNIVHLFKPVPSIGDSICFKVAKGVVWVGQNVESVMSLLQIDSKRIIADEPFVFMLNRKVITDLYNLVGDEVTIKVNKGNVDIELGDTKLSLLSLEDVEIPNIHINTLAKMEVSERIDPDYLQGALNNAIAIKGGVIGVLEGFAEVGDTIICGSPSIFVEVESHIEGLRVNVTPEFLSYIKNIARTATSWVKLYKSKDYVIAVNDRGLMYQGRYLQNGFPIKIDTLEKDRKKSYQGEFIIDKRALVTSLKKLSLVTNGVKEPKVKISINKNKLVLAVKSLNGKTSKDSIGTSNLKGNIKEGTTVRLELLQLAISVMDISTKVKIYDQFVVIQDKETRVIFTSIES